MDTQCPTVLGHLLLKAASGVWCAEVGSTHPTAGVGARRGIQVRNPKKKRD
jgi:hypothetical protein